MSRRPFVLFAAAAGAGIGFGHLVRCGVLAEALDTPRHLVLRGAESALDRALRFGWHVHRGRAVVDALMPDLIVVDDPSPTHRERWIRLARTAHVPVALVCDGDAGRIRADLVIDGSFAARPDSRRHRLAGPAFALLASSVGDRRRRVTARDPRRVAIAFGGGRHVRQLGAAVARDLVRTIPGVRVDVAAGFTDARLPRLPDRCRWVSAPAGLADLLAAAAVAIVAGGVTMYEACALGTPVVAVPVVPAQRPAIGAAAAAGAVHTSSRRTPRAIALAAGQLIASPSTAAAYASAAAQLVDGRGAARAAAALRDLIDAAIPRGTRHAA